MNAHFELLTRLSVYVGGTEHCVDLPFCGEGDRTDNTGARAFGGLDDILDRAVEGSLVERLEANPDFLSCCWLLGCCHKPYFLMISSWIFVGTRSKWLGSMV